MKSKLPALSAFCALGVVLFGPATGLAQPTQTDTLWTGPETNFTQSATNPTDVLIPGAVSLTRAYTQWLFNPAAGDQGPGPATPTDTEWAFGLLENYLGLSYATFASYRDGDLSQLLVGNPMVVHLINEDIYLSLTFSAWPAQGGYFAYTRSTPAPVTITNPADGAVFATPATVKIWAATNTTIGIVTNVAFYTNSTLAGVAQSAPFGITTRALAAGAYALTAVATAAGSTATSSVVNVTVVSPVAVTLSSQNIANGQFAFAYTADPGLSYVVQKSSNLVNWVSVITNVPTGNPASFTDNFNPGGARYYRVGRMPNP